MKSHFWIPLTENYGWWARAHQLGVLLAGEGFVVLLRFALTPKGAVQQVLLGLQDK